MFYTGPLGWFFLVVSFLATILAVMVAGVGEEAVVFGVLTLCWSGVVLTDEILE